MSSSLIKSEGRASAGLPLQKQKMHALAHWRGTICSNVSPKSSPSPRSSSSSQSSPVLLSHFEDELGLACGVKTEIEIVTHHAAVDLNDPVAGFELHLRAEALGHNFRDFDPAAANVCDCWCNGKLVHSGGFVPQRNGEYSRMPNSQGN